MSLRSDENLRGRAPSPGSLSITAKLTFLYTLSAFGMLVLATGFLYWVLARSLERENNQFLADKIHVLRAILRDRPENIDALEEEVKLEGAALQFSKYYVRILDERGHALMETPSINQIAAEPFAFQFPIEATEMPEAGRRWKSRDGRSYLSIAAWADLGTSGEHRRLLQLVLDVSHSEILLANYRRKLAIVLFLAVLFSAGAGAVVARRGMRPLQEITQGAQQITATQLHERIGPAGWPKELTSLALAFDGMLNRLEDSFTRLNQFSADLAHELRTPINSLRGEAEVALSRTRTPGEYRQVLESSLEELERLARMIDNLLFLARAEGAKIGIERSQFDALKEVEAIQEFYSALAEEQGVEVTRQGSASLYADPLLFRRAISNLLSNALQYTPHGGKITLSVRETEGQTVEVHVSDTGAGIDPEHLPRIFDRFYRADAARSQYPHGTGLGLSIAKSIMDLHGGTVTIQSEPSKGTTAILRFLNH